MGLLYNCYLATDISPRKIPIQREKVDRKPSNIIYHIHAEERFYHSLWFYNLEFSQCPFFKIYFLVFVLACRFTKCCERPRGYSKYYFVSPVKCLFTFTSRSELEIYWRVWSKSTSTLCWRAVELCLHVAMNVELWPFGDF